MNSQSDSDDDTPPDFTGVTVEETESDVGNEVEDATNQGTREDGIKRKIVEEKRTTWGIASVCLQYTALE